MPLPGASSRFRAPGSREPTTSKPRGSPGRILPLPAADERVLERVAAEDGTLRDLATGSSWSFTGAATSGPLAGEQLGKIYLLVEYWFDWRTYHPDTAVQR